MRGRELITFDNGSKLLGFGGMEVGMVFTRNQVGGPETTLGAQMLDAEELTVVKVEPAYWRDEDDD